MKVLFLFPLAALLLVFGCGPAYKHPVKTQAEFRTDSEMCYNQATQKSDISYDRNIMKKVCLEAKGWVPAEQYQEPKKK